MKTNELTGAALNWAVVKCEGRTPHIGRIGAMSAQPRIFVDGAWDSSTECNYTTNWAQAGPIIEREEIALDWRAHESERCCAAYDWDNPCFGPTLLIAAMRCYVANKLGDKVLFVPEELL